MKENIVDVYSPAKLANLKTTKGSQTNTWCMGPFPPTNAMPDSTRTKVSASKRFYTKTHHIRSIIVTYTTNMVSFGVKSLRRGDFCPMTVGPRTPLYLLRES